MRSIVPFLHAGSSQSKSAPGNGAAMDCSLAFSGLGLHNINQASFSPCIGLAQDVHTGSSLPIRASMQCCYLIVALQRTINEAEKAKSGGRERAPIYGNLAVRPNRLHDSTFSTGCDGHIKTSVQPLIGTYDGNDQLLHSILSSLNAAT